MDFELTEEQRAWQRAVHDFVSKEVRPRAQEVDETGEFNWDAVRKGAALGLLGLAIPEAYGGAGVDSISSAIAIEELGWACGSTALSLAAHNGLGSMPIVLYGSESLKQRWLPLVAGGKGKLAALALTEPGAGSDLQGGVKTKASRSGSEWIIDGSKMWCTNAAIAEYIVTLVRTDPAGGHASLSLIVVPVGTPGLTIGKPERKMGLHGSPTSAVTYDGVHVPLENLLGQEGDGLHQALTILDAGRISIAALSVGLAQAAYEYATAYARDRQAFGQSISRFEAIQWMIADAATEIEAAELLAFRAAALKEKGRPFTREASMAKVFSSEAGNRACHKAVQILGGYGYIREYPVERHLRDVKVSTIYEGTSEIQRVVIARDLLR